MECVKEQTFLGRSTFSRKAITVGRQRGFHLNERDTGEEVAPANGVCLCALSLQYLISIMHRHEQKAM